MSAERRGGVCRGEMCTEVFELSSDGRFSVERNGLRSQGSVAPTAVAALREALSTSAGSLVSLPRAEVPQCPTKRPGAAAPELVAAGAFPSGATDVTLTFHTEDGPVVVSNCAVVLDEANPVVRAALDVLG